MTDNQEAMSSPPAPILIDAPKPARTTSLSIEDLSRLSCEVSSWVFLSIIDRAARKSPDELPIALLGIRTLSALGLRTPALERLEALEVILRGNKDAADLKRCIEALPSDIVPLSRRLKMAKRNLDALGEQGAMLHDRFNAWSADESDWEHLRAKDGNVVRRPAGSIDSLDWLWVGDLRNGMHSIATNALEGIERVSVPQIVVEGVNPPWLLMAMSEQTTRKRFEYSPRLSIIQSDPTELFEGLSVADLRGLLSQPRLHLFVGDDASQRFERDAMSRMDEQLGKIGMTCSTVRTRSEPGLGGVIGRIWDAQRSEMDRLSRCVEAIYEGRDAKAWAARYRDALAPGSDSPLRVLIPSCRFTTYVQHAASSIRSAFERLGCETQLLIEQSDHANLSDHAYQRTLESFRPDLIVMINYTRSGCVQRLPAGAPHVCWIQDGVNHLFDHSTGAALGDLDFVVGHVYSALLTDFGYRSDRAMRFPVVADSEVFKPSGFSINKPARFDSEIAYVSHQSETPERMLGRQIQEAGGNYEPMLRTIAGRIGVLLRRAGAEGFRQPLWRMVESEVELTHPGAGRNDIAARTFHQFAIPLAERMIRQEMLQWAADICSRRGWKCSIYGNGWEEHPELCNHAMGAVKHGSELRDCYERSIVHLHASVCNPAHQRVQECALSGGAPLSRITRDAMQVEYELIRLGAAGRVDPCARDDANGLIGFRIAENPDLLAIAAQLQRMGMWMEEGPDPSLLWIERSDWDRREAVTEIPRIDTRTRWLFGDCSQCAFTSEEGLERLVERAIERPVWRQRLIDGIAGRVRERITVDRVAERMLGFIHQRLRDSAGGAAS